MTTSWDFGWNPQLRQAAGFSALLASVDFVFVGDPARLNADALRCRVVQTAARFELGTLEYLESLS